MGPIWSVLINPYLSGLSVSSSENKEVLSQKHNKFIFSVTLGWCYRFNYSEKAQKRTQIVEQLLQGGGLSIACRGTDILLPRTSLCYN